MKRFNDRVNDNLDKLHEGVTTPGGTAIILGTIGEELERIADALEEANRLACVDPDVRQVLRQAGRTGPESRLSEHPPESVFGKPFGNPNTGEK